MELNGVPSSSLSFGTTMWGPSKLERELWHANEWIGATMESRKCTRVIYRSFCSFKSVKAPRKVLGICNSFIFLLLHFFLIPSFLVSLFLSGTWLWAVGNNVSLLSNNNTSSNSPSFPQMRFLWSVFSFSSLEDRENGRCCRRKH